MRYKVTAVKDVIILAHVRKHPPGYAGPIQQPTESIMWVPVFANKPADGLGIVLGIDPKFVKDAPIKTKDGFSYVGITGTGDDFFAEHFGLFKIERSALPD